MHTKFMLENMKGRDCLGDTGINGKITSMDLTEIGSGLSSTHWSQGPRVGSCEHGNDPLVSIKGGECHD